MNRVSGIPRRALRSVLGLVLVGPSLSCLGPRVPGADPSRAGPALAQGTAWVEAGRFREALQPLAAACALPDTCSDALPYLAAGFRATRRYEDAIAFFGAVAERHPELAAEARVLRARFLESGPDAWLAVADYRESLALRPTAAIYGRLGKLLLRMRQDGDAVAALEAGIALDPDNLSLRRMLARAHGLRGDVGTSRALLQAVLDRDPNLGSAWIDAGRLRWLEGDEAGAVKDLERGLALQPDSTEARLLLARVALRRGDLSEARRLLAEIQRLEASMSGRGPGSE